MWTQSSFSQLAVAPVADKADTFIPSWHTPLAWLLTPLLVWLKQIWSLRRVCGIFDYLATASEIKIFYSPTKTGAVFRVEKRSANSSLWLSKQQGNPLLCPLPALTSAVQTGSQVCTWKAEQGICCMAHVLINPQPFCCLYALNCFVAGRHAEFSIRFWHTHAAVPEDSQNGLSCSCCIFHQ